MTTILILFILGFLSVWHSMHLEWLVTAILGCPNWILHTLMLIIVVLRISLFVYRFSQKYYPVWVGFTRSLRRLATMSNPPISGGKGLPKGKRGYSTVARAQGAHSSESLEFDPLLRNKDERSYKPINQGNKFSKRVMDKFFKVIAKKGALVSLTKDRVRPNLSQLFTKLGWRMFSVVFVGKGQYTSRLRQLYAFLVHLQNMRRHHGTPYVVKYCKVSQLAIQKAIAGTPVKSLCELEPQLFFPYVSALGIPKFVPVRDRRLIMSKQAASVIRWWLTLYSVYRVIYIPTVLKLATITDPLTVPMEQVIKVADQLREVYDPSMFDSSVLRNGTFKFLETASSTNKISWMGLISDCVALQKHNLDGVLIDYLSVTGAYDMARIFCYIRDNLAQNTDKFAVTSTLFNAMLEEGFVGKLSIKEEAAGKARVFAMVDSWTQSSLAPLHDMLFTFLKVVPNDATFDQEASVRRSMEKSSAAGQSFGYDLSAATDRLPIALQMAILDVLVPGISHLWSKLLVSRIYGLAHKVDGKKVVEKLQYAVGQPMGALSSWAMLAITHHALAQLASRKAVLRNPDLKLNCVYFNTWNGSFVWYTDYEVLGDDIVFFNEEVASQYLIIMDSIGVPINLSKSVIGRNPTFEFAKVTGHYGRNVSAISWAMFMAQPTLMGRAQIGYALCSKGIIQSKPIAVLSRLARAGRFTEGSPNPFFLALGTMFSKKGRLDWFEFLYAIMQKSLGYINIYQTLLDTSNIVNIQRAIAETIKTGEPASVPNPLEKKRGWRTDEFAIKLTQATVIRNSFNKLNPYNDAIKLAQDIILHPSMLLSFNEARTQSFIKKGVFTLDNRVLAQLSKEESFIHHIFLIFFRLIYDKLIVLFGEVSAQMGDLEGKTISELFDLLDKLDRYVEVQNLLNRANMKLAGETLPSRNLIESPLKALQILLDMDDPYGPTPEVWNPDYQVSTGAIALQGYLYCLERIDNLPINSLPVIGDSMSPYINVFRPINPFVGDHGSRGPV